MPWPMADLCNKAYTNHQIEKPKKTNFFLKKQCITFIQKYNTQ